MITGGVAAFKALELIRELTVRGMQVRAVMTEAAERFIARQSVAAVSGSPVATDLFSPDPSPHTELASWADLIVVVPATADFIAKLANGFAADLATTTILAAAAPVLIAPAMHSNMLAAPATQRNLATLVKDGRIVLPADFGRLAGGDVGLGRLLDPSWIGDAIELRLGGALLDLSDRRVLVSAGGTREAYDAVRYVGNRSSGRQGWAIAEAAALQGAEVAVVSTVDSPLPEGPVRVVRVESAFEMEAAMVEESAAADWIFMAAAVADFRPAEAADRKLKRDGVERLRLELVANPDILGRLVAGRRERQLIVGFAAETGSLASEVERKLATKRVDILVGNDISSPATGFGALHNQVIIADRFGGRVELPLLPKLDVAQELLRQAERVSRQLPQG